MDLVTYFKAFLGLAFVLGLILGLSYLLKRLGFGDGLRGPFGRKRRLATVETVMLDGRHKAILVRRNDVEHLVLLGPNTSQVIETGIPVPPAASGASGTPAEVAPTEATPNEAGSATRFSQWMKQ